MGAILYVVKNQARNQFVESRISQSVSTTKSPTLVVGLTDEAGLLREESLKRT